MEGGTSTLAASVLAGEEARTSHSVDPAVDDVSEAIPDDEMIGVGADAMPLRDVVASGGTTMLVVLFLLNLIDEFDRAAFAVLGPDIAESLGTSAGVIGVASAVGSALIFLVGVPVGYLADRMQRTRVLTGATLLWAAASAFTGMVQSTWQIFASRLFTGAGKANEGPVQKALLADAYPYAGRARVFAIHNLANPIGIASGPLFAGLIAAAFGDEGWRIAFLLLAAPALVLAVFAARLSEPKRGRNELAAIGVAEPAEPPSVPATGPAELAIGPHPDLAEPASDISVSAAFARFGKIRSFRSLAFALAAFGVAFVSVPAYLNFILEDQYGLGSSGRGLVGSLTALGGIAGVLVAGPRAEAMFRDHPERTLKMIAGGVAAYGVLLPVALYMPVTALFVVVAALAQAMVLGAFVPAQAVVASVVPYRLRSLGLAAAGLYLSIGGIGGALVVAVIQGQYGNRTALTVALPVAGSVAAVLLVNGSRFLRADMAQVVRDLRLEQAEAELRRGGDTSTLLSVTDMDYSYGPVQVLFGVTLDVREGEVLALLGTNGAGKSTVLRAVAGLGVVDRGTIRYRGADITLAGPGDRVRRGIVQVQGGKAVFDDLTVAENLLAGAFTYVRDRDRLRRRTDEMLDLFPRLRERFDQPAGTLSGGEQQMLAVAKALMLDPDLLIVDELSLGLAPIVVQELLEVVEDLKRRGVTIILVEQSLNVALAVADRAVFMEKGRVRFEGPADELARRDDLVRAVFLGGEGG